MINKDLFKKIIVKIRRHSGKGGHNVNRDWQLVLLAFGAVFIATTFLCWKLNLSVANEGVSTQTENKTSISINRTLLETVVNFYKNQEQLFSQDKAGPIEIGDPSK